MMHGLLVPCGEFRGVQFYLHTCRFVLICSVLFILFFCLCDNKTREPYLKPENETSIQHTTIYSSCMNIGLS